MCIVLQCVLGNYPVCDVIKFVINLSPYLSNQVVFYMTKKLGQKFKVGLPPSKKIHLYLLQLKPFKNDEKCFLFHLKSSSRSLDIQIFVLTFWLCRRNGLIRKTRLISKFLTSQPG